MTPYTPGEQPQNIETYTKLNTNENPYPPSPKVIKALQDFDPARLRLYPDPNWQELQKAASDFFKIPVEYIFCGNGSDEILDNIIRSFADPEDTVAMPNPNYSLYEVLCDIYGIKYTYVPSLMPDFTADFESLAKIPSKLIFFSNPNAPTGRYFPLSQIEAFIKNYNGVFICDEAYIQFGGESAIPLTKKYDNLLVVRTFSKAFSLAGLRVGFAIGSPSLIEGLMRAKDSYNLNFYQQIGGVAALQDGDYSADCCRKIISERERLSAALQEIGFTVIPSTANFIFCKPPVGSAEDTYMRLKEQKILIRYWSKELIRDWVRITIGTKEQNNILIQTAKAIYSGKVTG